MLTDIVRTLKLSLQSVFWFCRGILPARLSLLCVLILLVSHFLPWGAHQTVNSGTDLCLTAWTVLHVLLMRPHNIVLVALMTFQQSVLSRSKLVLTPSATAVYYMWIGRAAFFSQVTVTTEVIPSKGFLISELLYCYCFWIPYIITVNVL